MNGGDELVTSPAERIAATSFEELYAGSRQEIFKALATITADPDLATEAVDAGFTAWRRKIRRPAHVPPDVGVMALALKWARRQIGKKSSPMSGFRLSDTDENLDAAALDRFKKLSLDERGLLVMRSVLGWDDGEIRHALAADGIGAASRSLMERLETDGYTEERMARALQRRAATHVEPLKRLEAVKTKGTLQKLGVFGAGAALTAGTIVGAMAIIGNTGSTGEPPLASAAPTGGTSGVALTAENAVWEEVPMPVDTTDIMTMAHDGTNFYMLGMDDRGRAIMMESSTGLDWVEIPAPAAGRNMWFHQIVATPDALVAIGQGFDEMRGRESPLVFVSEDRETWNRIELPVENSIEAGGRVVDLHTWISTVLVDGSGFTVVGSQMADFDPAELIRDQVDPELFRHGYGHDQNGIEFYDNQGNRVHRVSWEELDLDPELVALISGQRSLTWTSPDGLEWDTSEGTGPPGAEGIAALAATGNVDAALAWGRFGPSLWLEDGGEWVRPDLDFVASALTSWDDKLIVAGTAKADGRPGIWKTTDGTTWEESQAAAGVIRQFHTSADGLVGLGYGADGGVATLGPAEIKAGDLTVLASSDGHFEVIDAEGNTVVDVFGENVTRGQKITITDPDTGEVVVEFDEMDFELAWETVYRESDIGRRPQRPEVTIFLSPDGTNWTNLPVEDSGFNPNSIAFGNGSILMVGWSERDGFLDFGGERPQMYLVHPG